MPQAKVKVPAHTVFRDQPNRIGKAEFSIGQPHGRKTPIPEKLQEFLSTRKDAVLAFLQEDRIQVKEEEQSLRRVPCEKGNRFIENAITRQACGAHTYFESAFEEVGRHFGELGVKAGLSPGKDEAALAGSKKEIRRVDQVFPTYQIAGRTLPVCAPCAAASPAGSITRLGQKNLRHIQAYQVSDKRNPSAPEVLITAMTLRGVLLKVMSLQAVCFSSHSSCDPAAITGTGG